MNRLYLQKSVFFLRNGSFIFAFSCFIFTSGIFMGKENRHAENMVCFQHGGVCILTIVYYYQGSNLLLTRQ